MDNTREKLIELLWGKQAWGVGVEQPIKIENAELADHLIRNGVGFVEHDCHWATEQAYKNGYEKGYADGERKDR